MPRLKAVRRGSNEIGMGCRLLEYGNSNSLERSSNKFFDEKLTSKSESAKSRKPIAGVVAANNDCHALICCIMLILQSEPFPLISGHGAMSPWPLAIMVMEEPEMAAIANSTMISRARIGFDDCMIRL